MGNAWGWLDCNGHAHAVCHLFGAPSVVCNTLILYSWSACVQVDGTYMADPSSQLQAIGLLNLMQTNTAAAAAAAAAAGNSLMPVQDAAVAEAAAAAAAAGSAAIAAAAAAAAAGSATAAPRSRAALRQHLQQEYEQAGLTRRLTSLDLQVRKLAVFQHSNATCLPPDKPHASAQGAHACMHCLG